MNLFKNLLNSILISMIAILSYLSINVDVISLGSMYHAISWMRHAFLKALGYVLSEPFCPFFPLKMNNSLSFSEVLFYKRTYKQDLLNYLLTNEKNYSLI